MPEENLSIDPTNNTSENQISAAGETILAAIRDNQRRIRINRIITRNNTIPLESLWDVVLEEVYS